ncbi:hypothetical protein GCM10023215_37900 [Pseudonocardia yuanmonensis]|uniref:STAS domain-containing protein n=1 Tax=Pseudonocardia yuanmonensis TaxID=1095914 RepID=A0ABP8WXQ8_9PSEU
MTVVEGGSLAVEAPRPGVCVVYVTGLLDQALATRLARVLDERLHPALRHVLVDLAGVDRMEPGSVPLLRSAIRIAGRRRVSLHLTGAGALGAHLGVRDRRVLAEFAAFPTVPAALAVLAAAHRHGRPGPGPR